MVCVSWILCSPKPNYATICPLSVSLDFSFSPSLTPRFSNNKCIIIIVIIIINEVLAMQIRV